MAPDRSVVLLPSAVIACVVLAGVALSTAGPASAARTDTGSAVVEATSGWRQVDAGGAHTCGIRTNGRLYCWGSDGHGQLGNGGANADEPIPVQVAGNISDWVTVSAGDLHTCARRSDRRLYCWGLDYSGQLGDGGTLPGTDQATPVQVAGNRTDWATVSAGGYQTCARRTTGRLYCWGADDSGQVGDGGADANQATPVPVAGNRTDWAGVSAGTYHTCARRTTGRLYCWGYDRYGELGDGGASANQPNPAPVAGTRADWATVTAGGNQTCGRRSDRRLYCWGLDYSGQLGDGGTLPGTDQATPVQVAGNRTDWATVTTGGGNTCARRTNGRLYCWGSDDFGELGDGGTNTDLANPVQVAGNHTDWATVTAGGVHTCALITTGRLYCWGADYAGQLGDGGANTGQSTPVEVIL